MAPTAGKEELGFVAAILLAPLGLALLLFILAENRIVGHAGFPLDDSWIHFELARSLSLGAGLSFAGGESVAASSAPLWTLVVAAFHLLPGAPVIWVKALGSVMLWVTGLSVWGIATRLGLGRVPSILCGIITVMTPRLVWGALSGMEVPLYVALSTAGIWLHLRELHRPGTMLASVILFAMAALSRPECLALFPLAMADRWAMEAFKQKWQVARPILLYCCFLAPWFAYNMAVAGKPLPSTYYAKVGNYGVAGALVNFDLGQLAKTALYYPLVQLQEVLVFAARDNLVLACAAPLGLALMVGASLRRSGGGSLLIPLTLILLPLARGVVAPFQGPLFQHGRYVAHLAPLLVIAGALGLRQTALLVASGLSSGTEKGAFRTSALIWFLSLAAGVLALSDKAEIYALNVGEIEEMHVDMAYWIRENTPKGALIASHDVGALGYFSGRRVVDTVGLMTPEILEFLPHGEAPDEGVLDYLRLVKPEYVVIMPAWYPRLAGMTPLLEPVHEEQIDRSARTITAGDRLVVYRTAFSGAN